MKYVLIACEESQVITKATKTLPFLRRNRRSNGNTMDRRNLGVPGCGAHARSVARRALIPPSSGAARADLPAPTRPAALLAAGNYLDKRGE